MINELLKECENERKKLQRTRRKFSTHKGFQEYADGRETEVKIKEEIIKILCGADEMTPEAAEKILNDTKRLINIVAMRQPIQATETKGIPDTDMDLVNEYLRMMDKYKNELPRTQHDIHEEDTVKNIALKKNRHIDIGERKKITEP